MIFYGIELAAGTLVKDLTVEGGTIFPSTNLQKGRMFFNTSSNALFCYDGTNWVSAGGAGVTSFHNRTGAVTIQATDLVGKINETNLPKAGLSTLGGVKVGSGLTIDGGGVMSVATTTVVEIPSGSRLLWAQSAAPTGWTQITTSESNDRLLRVVSAVGGTSGSGGTGGYGYGGTDSPILNNKIPSHTHTFSGTTNATGNHNHIQRNIKNVDMYLDTPTGTTPNQYGTGNYSSDASLGLIYTSTTGNHSHTVSGTTNANSGADTWQPKYLNLILCSKN